VRGGVDIVFFHYLFNSENIIIFDNFVVKMPGEKVAPPKPEGLKKKEERDTKLAAALKQLREQRRASNKAKRQQALKRAQEHEAAYQKASSEEITARRQVAISILRPNSPDKSTSLPSPDSPSL
jgi:hypothetical protein